MEQTRIRKALKEKEVLSEHLLRESEKFFLYPSSHSRTKGNLALQNALDNEVRKWAEWRKTFAPRPAKEDELLDKLLNSPRFFDQLYCRDLLRQVPKIVGRHQALSELILSEIEDREAFAYLKEAANCYILGLPQAAIALSRAAVEAHLRKAVSKSLGSNTVRGEGLKTLISFSRRGQLLSTKGRELANKVREAADDVLHVTPSDSGSALPVIEAARAVILELEGKKGRSGVGQRQS